MTEIVKRIIISGPESTGKSLLSKQLANHYKTIYLPEYARTYIENLNRPYSYNDLIIIAKKQIMLEEKFYNEAKGFLFIDTGLIITKVWFQEVFKKYPDWLDTEIKKYLPQFYLMCNYDLPWQSDKVRENGSKDRREYLMKRYIQEIKNIGSKFYIVSGNGEKRLKNAINYINKHD